ncbi:MAG TPA: LLM class flavin-dependent oxidoreductase, partial [Candidatus Binataceae bacterium]|nr:LLM class flavin-dependent oxidoreductase [Candidatus Binataceae bacterium]
MNHRSPKFGLTLPNRGVIICATTVEEMLQMAAWADNERAWDSVWVGDSIFAKPRLDAIALLGALAARTRRVRL